jgi:hypothetical protein
MFAPIMLTYDPSTQTSEIKDLSSYSQLKEDNELPVEERRGTREGDDSGVDERKGGGIKKEGEIGGDTIEL